LVDIVVLELLLLLLRRAACIDCFVLFIVASTIANLSP
jgi:hypothetical protein